MNSNATTIDDYLAQLPGWQTAALNEFRDLVRQCSDAITEEIKWGVPAFVYKSKVIFVMAAFKSHVKYNFILNGAKLDDPHRLFNNGLESAKSRGIDVNEGQAIDEGHIRGLIKEAISKV